MKAKSKGLIYLSKGFIVLSALSLLSVSIMAFMHPESVMDLVQVTLPNTDAISSIRGVYGGVGLTIVVFLLRCLKGQEKMGLQFLCFLWGLYALSRIITIVSEGRLGAFGTQWLVIESVFFGVALVLYLLNSRRAVR
jgi:hypothetical protein